MPRLSAPRLYPVAIPVMESKEKMSVYLACMAVKQNRKETKTTLRASYKSSSKMLMTCV